MPLSEFFVTRLSEEIRLQIEGVLALSQRLGRQPLSPDARACAEGVEEAAAAVARLLAAADDLRLANQQNLVLQPAPEGLRDFMDAVQERWRDPIRSSGAILHFSYEGDPAAAAMIDAPRLHQVFDGLISRALACDYGGAVEAALHVDAAGELMRLEGRVRHAGLPQPQEADLLSPEVDARFGLEAAISAVLGQQALDAMGGRLAIESNTGGGTTMVFTLDAAPACSEAAPAQCTQERAAHVLIVDDNATNRMVAETLCEMFDCTAETAVDGVEAVELARTGRFDLILMDIRMPRMDGVAATQAIRALPAPACHTPIIALTANADPEDAARYLAAGMISVVEKPMKPENLLRALQQALGESAAAA